MGFDMRSQQRYVNSSGESQLAEEYDTVGRQLTDVTDHLDSTMMKKRIIVLGTKSLTRHELDEALTCTKMSSRAWRPRVHFWSLTRNTGNH